MSFTAADMERVAASVCEIGPGRTAEESLEWLKAREIDSEAISLVVGAALRGFARKLQQDGDVQGGLIDIVGQTFRLGWEAALSTRGEL